MDYYTSMPVNLLAGFSSGDIVSGQMASVYEMATGNQILDGTKLYESEEDLAIKSLSGLPATGNPKAGFFTAANNQAAQPMNAVPGSTRSWQISKRLGGFLRDEKNKVDPTMSYKMLANDIQDPVADAVVEGSKLPGIIKSAAEQFGPGEKTKLNFIASQLTNWDGTFEAKSTAATVYTLWRQRAIELFFHGVDKNLVARLERTEQFQDTFMDLMDQIYRQPSQTKFNDSLCVSAYLIYSGSLQNDYKPKCLYLTGFAALLAYDDIKDWSKRQGEYPKRTANKLKDDFVPTWSEFTASQPGVDGIEGNQNTIRQSRLSPKD